MLLFLLLALLVLGAGAFLKALQIAIIIAVIVVLVGLFTGRSTNV